MNHSRFSKRNKSCVKQKAETTLSTNYVKGIQSVSPKTIHDDEAPKRLELYFFL